MVALLGEEIDHANPVLPFFDAPEIEYVIIPFRCMLGLLMVHVDLKKDKATHIFYEQTLSIIAADVGNAERKEGLTSARRCALKC